MAILDPIYATPLAVQLIPQVERGFADQLKLTPEQRSIGLISVDNDDATYTAIDEATKMADVEVVYARSFYAGARHTSGKWSGEIMAILAGPDPAEVRAGLGAAVDYLCGLGMDAIRQHEVELAGEAIAKLEAIEGVAVHGPKDAARRGAAISFSVEGIHPHDVGTLVDREGVAVRAGHHCAKPLIRALGHTATTRASFYLYHTSDDVDRLVDAIVKTKRFFLG